ncbi:MAG: hypothetical protein QNJ81_16075 [Acidimicrobiia bacterium]|nr:hypothetical protein [Acidimicrobiia bacterium]
MYRVSFEFRLTRLLPWPEDGTDFYGHVESVRAKIGSHEFVEDVRAITDRAESLLTFDFLIDAAHHEVANAAALRLVRDAIENCGARHFGLGAAAIGALTPAGARSGLETPIWHRRRVLVGVAA